MMSMGLSDIAILQIKNGDCCCIVSKISKTKAINLLQIVDFAKKSGKLKKLNIRNNFRSCKITSNSNLNKKKCGTL